MHGLLSRDHVAVLTLPHGSAIIPGIAGIAGIAGILNRPLADEQQHVMYWPTK